MIETTADHEPMGLVEVFGDRAQGEEEQESTLVMYSCCCTQKAVASISIAEYELQTAGSSVQMGYQMHL